MGAVDDLNDAGQLQQSDAAAVPAPGEGEACAGATAGPASRVPRGSVALSLARRPSTTIAMNAAPIHWQIMIATSPPGASKESYMSKWWPPSSDREASDR